MSVAAAQACMRSCCLSAYICIVRYFFCNGNVCFLFFKISSFRGSTFTYSQFLETANCFLFTLKRLLFFGFFFSTFLIPTAKLLIIPGSLFCIVCFSAMLNINYFKIPITLRNIIFNCCFFVAI